MTKNYLLLAPVRTLSLSLTKYMDVFCIYEIAKRGLVLQKHGLNSKGRPFPVRDQAINWTKEQVRPGKCIFKEKIVGK
jgi:hypothetical protein